MDAGQTPPPGKFAATVKVEPKGQVVVLSAGTYLISNPGILCCCLPMQIGIALRQELLTKLLLHARPAARSSTGR